MQMKKSPGPDALTPEILKLDTETTAECLAIIYNKSFQTCKAPFKWKESHVTPIHKGGTKDDASNYRPISLTSITCKLAEHLVLRAINNKLDDILSHSHHGFRANLSCETQLVITYHDICKLVDGGNTVHALILDFRKAFDVVPHSLLIEKLITYDFDPHLIAWICDFLLNRNQKTVLTGQQSEQIQVTSGVPQGSVIGPKLFLIYINDLPEGLNCQVRLFADDTLLYRVVNNSLDSINFQASIATVEQWAEKWGMGFNVTKTKFLAFGRLPNRGDASNYVPYSLKGDPIKEVTKAKYLGITIQSNLKFEDHMENTINKAMRILGMIKRNLHNAPRKNKLLAFTSLCRPILEYGSSVWDPHQIGHIKALEMVQNRAIRFICKMRNKTDSITLNREKVGLDTLENRRKNARLKLLLNMMSDRHPVLSEFIENETNIGSTNTTTRSQTRHHLPSIATNTTTYLQSFLPKTIRDMRGQGETDNS